MLLVNNPGDWGNLYGPLAHAKWDGWTFTDLIFPFFVFISGISMTISLARRAQTGDSKCSLLWQTVKRGAVIIAIGLALNFIPAFDLATVRIPGVLQRLGLCAMLVAPMVLYCNWRQQLLWAVGLLVSYTAIQTGVSVPDASGVWHTVSLQPGEDVGAWLDRWLLEGHLWRSSKTWDPEGLLSTVPAVASALAGVLTGQWLKTTFAPAEKTAWMFLVGFALLVTGQVLGAWSMPINKSLWSPAYVLVTAGWAALVFASFYWLLDAMPNTALRTRASTASLPLVIFGMNALFLFALSGLAAKMLGFIQMAPGVSLKAGFYGPLQTWGWAPVNTSLAFALVFTGAMFVAAWAMWRKCWFVKV
jgi:predicted acyltransferase